MSSAIEAFQKRIGPPDGDGEAAFTLPAEWAQGAWSYFTDQSKAGMFMDGFLELFNASIMRLQPTLGSWSFLFQDRPEVERWVIGRNAYGYLLVLEDPVKEGTRGKVGMLDPFQVCYTTDDNLTLISLVGRWLPMDQLPGFLDDSGYREWRAGNPGRTLGRDEILAFRHPRFLGGEVDPSNLNVENLLAYYESTGPIYRKALGM